MVGYVGMKYVLAMLPKQVPSVDEEIQKNKQIN